MQSEFSSIWMALCGIDPPADWLAVLSKRVRNIHRIEEFEEPFISLNKHIQCFKLRLNR